MNFPLNQRRDDRNNFVSEITSDWSGNVELLRQACSDELVLALSLIGSQFQNFKLPVTFFLIFVAVFFQFASDFAAWHA